MSSIGDRIVKLRERKGWSQRALAKKVEINYSVMNRIESGERPIKDIELDRIATELDTTTDYLLGRTENVSSPKGMTLDDKIASLIKKHPNMNLMFDGLDQMDDERKERMVDRIIEMIEFENYKESKKK